ncbi:uncharacterized protein N7458_006436 [Penicillium daleae]|uniref:NAD(P)-binding protein n=1 Tax=Penicillium daleae TaxID=63821 RepID=A0AAD6C4A1_9EURO|nr:uncharacterized protein N7458_006436 [Penicillium daleae]KAJ5449987.1 hypothetical protein N7458_006436 [Penicillium daleae]
MGLLDTSYAAYYGFTVDQFSLKGNTAVISGGVRGLGFAFAEALAEAGANIAILDIGTPQAGSLEKQVNEVVETIEKEFGNVDVNINAAGVATDEPFLATSDKNLSSTFNVNFVGSFLVAQACANSMVRKWEKLGKPELEDAPRIGSIIFISSVAISAPRPLRWNWPNTVSGQFAVPWLNTNGHDEKVEQTFPDLLKQFNQESMFGRVGEPEELKPAILYLASGTWKTGQDLLVDGGVSSWKHRGNW